MLFPPKGVCNCGCRVYARDENGVWCVGCQKHYDNNEVPTFNEEEDLRINPDGEFETQAEA